jgi:hypothetical protein
MVPPLALIVSTVKYCQLKWAYLLTRPTCLVFAYNKHSFLSGYFALSSILLLEGHAKDTVAAACFFIIKTHLI